MNPKRKAIWNKSKGHCWYCGDPLKKVWHADHFLPLHRVQDGRILNPENENPDNLVPACPSCNIIKSSMDIEAFRWLIGNFITRLNRDLPVYRHAKRFGLVEETGKEVKFWFERKGINETRSEVVFRANE